ncbi:MAG TPA: hypothetical protein VFB54_15880 [Burkholderiales bacterium]|nr:hypothetical protein [Burkholderiales bacterium]
MKPSVMKLSELLEVRIVDARGRKLGRVMDVRGPQPANPATLRVTEIVYGERGFFEKIGFGKGQAKCLPWSGVEQICAFQITMREVDRS